MVSFPLRVLCNCIQFRMMFERFYPTIKVPLMTSSCSSLDICRHHSVVNKKYFCGFPLHIFYNTPGYLHCTKRCLNTPGCISFNFRRNQDGGHTCFLIAPSVVFTSYVPEPDAMWDMHLIEQVADMG